MSDRVDFESIFECLNDAGVRYVCVGGVAVVLRGVDRITADVDLVVELTQTNALAAIEALLAAGSGRRFQPTPVALPSRKSAADGSLTMACRS